MRFSRRLAISTATTTRNAAGAPADLLESLDAGGQRYHFISLRAAQRAGLIQAFRLPVTLRILLENSLRCREPGDEHDLQALRDWLVQGSSDQEISFHPARVLMPDASGIPLLGDLAAMREAVSAAGGDPAHVNPMIPVDVVVDHSCITEYAGSDQAYDLNLALEYRRNAERYTFLKWAQGSFANLRVIPPSMGIAHQVNVEHLARVVWTGPGAGGRAMAYPDTLVGLDSHTPMVNGIGVLGWGVGGIEAGAAMLGQPISMLLPEVVGCRITGRPQAGVTSTDIVLTLTEALRRRKLVGKFVEYYGDGLDHLPLSHRATISNMAPESGATMCFFPVDQATIDYLQATGRSAEQIELVRAYAHAQGLWRPADGEAIVYSERMEFDLGAVRPSMAGPSRPQDRVDLGGAPQRFAEAYAERLQGWQPPTEPLRADVPDAPPRHLQHGDIVLAAITSCTNTSNPQAMVGAGLLARKLRQRGVGVRPWVKTSLAPGSRVVMDYLEAAGLKQDLDALGFQLVGYGCMTCAGASGPLAPEVAAQIEESDLVVASVLSGNRNFEGRTHALVRANFLCSPALVVAYACAGSIGIDLTRMPLALGRDGRPVWLSEVWPDEAEIETVMREHISATLYRRRYADSDRGEQRWQALQAPRGMHYDWDEHSTYIRRPPYFELDNGEPGIGQGDIVGARPLALLGDSITTDHISPVHAIRSGTVAGDYLAGLGVEPADFNTLLTRRGNHEVMMRGTFDNPRLRNAMAGGREGGWTRHEPDGGILPVYQAAERYRAEGVPLVVVAGGEYGTGSSRDWAAKGTRLLGVRAVIAESFERIHRSNLVGMGVLPLQLPPGTRAADLGLDGSETFTVTGPWASLQPRQALSCEIRRDNGESTCIELICRLDIPREIAWYRAGGILPYVAGVLVSAGAPAASA
ncbi:aconitate hydratase AcnA [Candidimonas nitroreducens]|uniref:aconitate hydratase AcnA n=1 Tax=Candidimonas nitroreducens TaxID=683354 RepID=UPI0038BAA3F8